MKKTRKEQGITLIALIITIIVLLILALVTINAIQGDDSLIVYANNAKTMYTTEGENENSLVQNALEKLKEYDSNEDENEDTNYPFINNTVYSAVLTHKIVNVPQGATIYFAINYPNVAIFYDFCNDYVDLKQREIKQIIEFDENSITYDDVKLIFIENKQSCFLEEESDREDKVIFTINNNYSYNDVLGWETNS